MFQVKLIKIDDVVTVVTDEIYQRKLPSGKKGKKKYKKIKKLVKELENLSLSDNSFSEKHAKLVELMVKKEFKPSEIKAEDMSIKQETYLLAGSDIDESKRIKMNKRISAIHDMFEYGDDGYVYLKGYSIPIPVDLGEALLDAHYNEESNYTVDSLMNFWKWALLNSNPEARNDLFKWFKTGEFSITDSGMIVAYRCVDIHEKGINDELTDFVEKSVVQVKKWKKSPKNYGVILNDDGDYRIINLKTHPESVKASSYKGVLSDLYADVKTNEASDVYTDHHSRTMRIKIGEEVSMPRENCDENREAQCSTGLHFMSKKYNLRYGEEKIIILINPMNIVAFPTYDQTKGRCCAYFPVAKALTDDNGEIDEFKAGTYEFEYAEYGRLTLEKMFDGYTLEELQDNGMIASDISIGDIRNLYDSFKDMLKDKVDYV